MISKAEELIFDEVKLIKFRKECKKRSKKVVFVTGVFDILHVGHLRFLEKAKKYGDVLIVGINDDVFAKTKGANRPIQNEFDRANLIAGFECVSCVHIYDIRKDDTMDILRIVRPDVFIMSTSSTRKPEERLHHSELVRKMGGQVIVFDACSTIHSTSIINKSNGYSHNRSSLRNRLIHKKSKIFKIRNL